MRTKSTLRTFLYGIFLTSIIAILGLYKTKVLLNCLGKEYVGVYQLFSQLYIYLSLVEGGIGAGVAFYLYKPVNDNDERKIKSIFVGAKYYFNIVGILIIILGVLLSFGIMFLINETTISAIYIKACFMLFVLSGTTNYFTMAHALLYESEQKLYKSSNLNHILSICESIVAIVVAKLGGSLLLILSLFLILSVSKNIILVLNSRRDHKYVREINGVDKDLSFKKEANNLIITKVNTLVNENIDIILLSKFVNLTSVVIYTAYNQIVSMIKQMVERLNSALLPSVGNLLVAEKHKAKKTFADLNCILFYIGSILFVPLLYMLTPFINLWYGNEYTVNNLITFMFTCVLYINVIKISLEAYIKASGEFKSVKNSSIYQSITNTIFSLLLVKKYNIGGVLFATLFAFVTGNFVHYPNVICKKIIYDNPINYYKKCVKYIFGLTINIVMCNLLNSILVNSNLLMWFINGAILFAANFILTTVYYYVVKETALFERTKYLFSRKANN